MTDSREIAHRPEGGALAERPESSSLVAMILEAARDPTVDAAKVETMANLAIKLQDRERESQFAKDFAAALMEMPYISKRGTIVIPAKDGRPAREQGKFATFEDLDKVVRPILARHNLVISFKLGSDGGGVTAVPILTHRNGFRDIGEALKLPPDTSGSKNAAQAVGSSSQYGKRYAMCAALNIVTVGEDTDGRSYPLPDDPMTDRQQRLVAEAEAASANGEYLQWYAKQIPTERAWLVLVGVHARLGGGQPIADNRDPAPAEGEARGDPEPDSGAKRKASPDELLERYVAGLGKVADLDSLIEYQSSAAKFLGQLREKHPALHEKALRANSEAFSRLSASPSGADQSSANEPDGLEADSGSLFERQADGR